MLHAVSFSSLSVGGRLSVSVAGGGQLQRAIMLLFLHVSGRLSLVTSFCSYSLVIMIFLTGQIGSSFRVSFTQYFNVNFLVDC